jgi:pimeloyl-ACP methyl ester carboxylesterase
VIASRRRRGRPLIWIHGWLGDQGGARVLRDLGSPLIAVDLPGYGAGSKALGIEAGLRATVEAAAPLDGPVLVGHSMGGLVAVRAARSPDVRPRGLVLLAPVPPVGVVLEPRGYELFTGATNDPVLLAKVVDYLTAKRLPPRWVKSVVRRARKTASSDALRTYLEGWVRPDPELPPPEPLDVPALVVLGRYDRAITPDLAAREIVPWLPRAEIVVLEECGHFPLAEVPLRTLRLIEDFLVRIDGGDAPRVVSERRSSDIP